MARALIEAIVQEAAKAYPLEACGLLLGQGATVEAIQPTANVHPQPERHFEIDPAALIAAHRGARMGGAQVIGYYHSHPSGSARPSPTDAAMAARDGRVWAIVGYGSAQAHGEPSVIEWWMDGKDGFEALSLRVIGV